MKVFHGESPPPRAEMLNLVVEVSIRVMRRVRAQLRSSGVDGLSFTQARSLGYLHRSPGASLTDVSEHLGLQAPTTSKTIEELVQLGLVQRDTAEDDRRRVTLRPTEEGERALERVFEPVLRSLDEVFAPLGEEEREAVCRAMSLLLPLLDPSAGEEREVAVE